MIGPTYIAGDYRISSYPSNSSRLIFNLNSQSTAREERFANIETDLIIYLLNNGAEAFDISLANIKALNSFREALTEWDGVAPELLTRLDLSELPGLNKSSIKDKEIIYETVNRGLEKSGRDTFDLISLHEPVQSDPVIISGINEILRSMIDRGLANMIGISGPGTAKFKQFISKDYFDIFTGYHSLNACNLDALISDIPLLRREGLGYFNYSVNHMSLLGGKLEQYSRERAGGVHISERDIDIAVMASRIARKSDMSLSEMAFRYAVSTDESDRIAANVNSVSQARDVLDKWKRGPLDIELFDRITKNTLKYYRE